jgi:hypothetical protein
MFIYKIIVTKLRTFIGVAVLLSLLVTSTASFAYAEQTRIPMSSPAAAVSGAAARYGQLPLSFVANAGQSDPDVRFQARTMGGTVYFEDAAVVLSLPMQDSARPTGSETHSAVQLTFDGVSAAHRVVNAERLPGIVNYFIGNQPSRWLTDLPTYAGIVYQQLYPGIDLRYDGTQQTLKGTYTLAPHANAARIGWHYDGVESQRVDESTGDLILTLDDTSTLVEKAPLAWQTMVYVQM